CFAPVQWFQFASQGNNVERENNCQFGLPFDRRLVNPLIYPPNVNPGPIITITHALKWNSPAKDSASPQWCGPNAKDQRGGTSARTSAARTSPWESSRLRGPAPPTRRVVRRSIGTARDARSSTRAASVRTI